MKALLLILLITSCAHKGPTGSPKEGKTVYEYTDISGGYRLSREFKNIKQKIISRSQILNNKESDSRVVEKSITVSTLGSIRGKKARLVTLRPEASEFTVWLEGKKYSSRMRINSKNKSMRLTLNSPETRWQGTSEIPFPRGKYFCFYNQIPECLYHNYLFQHAFDHPNQKFDFYIVWDGYPFIQDQLSRVGKNLFAPATIKFDGEIKKNFRYIVEVEGQMILYQLSQNFDLRKISWIVQGISVALPGEEISGDLDQ